DMPAIAHANIKSLVSTLDRVTDVQQPTSEIRRMLSTAISDQSLLKLREELIGDVGLLCVYPISKDSVPKELAKRDGKRQRLALDAVADVMGVGFFFPESRGFDSGYTYYSADLSAERLEDAEEADIDAVDAADELAGEAADADPSVS